MSFDITHRHEHLEPWELQRLAEGSAMHHYLVNDTPVGIYPGDDVARIVVSAQKLHGSKEAAEVIQAYRRAFDAARRARGEEPVTDDGFSNLFTATLRGLLSPQELKAIGFPED